MAAERIGIEAARRVHLVGIGGAAMGAFATLLLAMGKTVSGSDVADGLALQRLRARGARVFVGHTAEHVPGDAEYVIRSAAVPVDNPEVQEAARRGLPNVKVAEAVGELMRGRQGVAIAGTHGKTTTTALVTWLLEQAGLEPLALIGGDALNFDSPALLGDGPMVIEADEYDRRFLTLSPEVAIVTSVEADHLDYFADLAEIQQTFQTFVNLLPEHGRLVVCADVPGAMRLTSQAERQTYGFAADADWRILDYAPLAEGGSRFRVAVDGRAWDVRSGLVGAHNARNAVAAVAATDALGVGLRSALASLATFKGTRRRFETKGRPNGVWVLDDYAHHPTALAATLETAWEIAETTGGGAVWAIFQPHTTNRTAALLEEFAASFGRADHALVLPIYRPSGREVAARPVSAQDLVARVQANGHQDARYADTFDEAVAAVRAGARPGDVVLTLGAGDVTALSDRLVRELDA